MIQTTIYIPPHPKDALAMKLLRWALIAMGSFVFLVVVIASMWIISAIHDTGGFSQFFTERVQSARFCLECQQPNHECLAWCERIVDFEEALL